MPKRKGLSRNAMLALSHSIGATEKTRNQIREDMLAGIPLQKHFEKIIHAAALKRYKSQGYKDAERLCPVMLDTADQRRGPRSDGLCEKLTPKGKSYIWCESDRLTQDEYKRGKAIFAKLRKYINVGEKIDGLVVGVQSMTPKCLKYLMRSAKRMGIHLDIYTYETTGEPGKYRARLIGSV